MKIDRNESGGLDETPEAKSVAADSAVADAEVAKLAADLQDLRQTLLRRQADFDNYRKRIERERAEDSKRTTARVVEALIPIVDGFEQALAAQPFDPHQHQAVDRAESTDQPDGTVLQVFQPGYLFGGRVLRPAMVRVAVHPTRASKSSVN